MSEKYADVMSSAEAIEKLRALVPAERKRA
jgi:hypothetical protein